MSNHYHLVVKLVPQEAEGWTIDEVLTRWTALFRGPLLVQRYRQGGSLSAEELTTLRSMARVLRQRLTNLSWFMKCLNEPIARKANAEDECTGHFWEARFQSQALCSEQALLAAMAYVDLNPIRAGCAETPEQSSHTSLKARVTDGARTDELLAHVDRLLKSGELHHFGVRVRPLLRFLDQAHLVSATTPYCDSLPIDWTSYLRLVDAVGRLVVRGKRSYIDPALPPILDRLGLSATQWLSVSTNFRQHYRRGDICLRQSVRPANCGLSG